MTKTNRLKSAIKILPILISCGFIVFGVSLRKKSKTDQEEPVNNIQTSDKTNSAWTSFFPDGLMDSDGVDVSLEGLKGKIVGLYFSASWCIPCHSFTPHLVKFRDQYKKHFEVILVGRDYTIEKQLEYMKELNMAFPTTKWANDKNTQSNNLKEKYKAIGIPRLVILSSDGQLIIDNACKDIQSTPENVAELFSNKQKLDELLAEKTKAVQAELQEKTKTYNKAL